MRTIAMASLLGFAALAHGQIDSDFDLHLTNGAQVKVPILVDSASSELLRYDLDSGLMTLNAGDVIDGDYSQPLFCFDFGDPQSEPVVLDVVDANGHTIMFDVGLGSALKYRTAEEEVSLSVPSSAQCFFKDSEGVFGLFGRVSSGSRANDSCAGPDNCLFSSDFATYPELQIEYGNVSSAGPGETVVYDIIISNTGDADANELAFQEVFPSNASVYTASLDGGSWSCTDNWDLIACPEGNGNHSGAGPLRFQNLYLPSGAEMTFTVTRTVDQNADGTIHLHAGVVDGAGNTAENDVAEATIGIVGDPAALAFASQPTDTVLGDPVESEAGEPIVVHVVDSSGNQVTGHNSGAVKVELQDGNGVPVLDLVGYTGIVDGAVVFDQGELSTDDSSIATGQNFVLRAISSGNLDSAWSTSFDIVSAN